jgi:hypothetical protein
VSGVVGAGDGAWCPLVGLIVLVAVVSMAWHVSRARSLLEEWARRNDFELVETEHRHLARGPFFWTTAKGQTVYRVMVRTRDGAVRKGWVRCGGFFLGLLSDHVDVRWDE